MADEAVEGRDAFLEERRPGLDAVAALTSSGLLAFGAAAIIAAVLSRLSTVVMVSVATMNSNDVTMPISGRWNEPNSSRCGVVQRLDDELHADETEDDGQSPG